LTAITLPISPAVPHHRNKSQVLNYLLKAKLWSHFSVISPKEKLPREAAFPFRGDSRRIGATDFATIALFGQSVFSNNYKNLASSLPMTARTAENHSYLQNLQAQNQSARSTISIT